MMPDDNYTLRSSSQTQRSAGDNANPLRVYTSNTTAATRVEHSSFSPDSPERPRRASASRWNCPITIKKFSAPSISISSSAPAISEKPAVSRPRPPPESPLTRLSRFFRAPRTPPPVPMQFTPGRDAYRDAEMGPSFLSPWPALQISKRNNNAGLTEEERKRRRKRRWIIIAVVLLVLLIITAIALAVTFLRPGRKTNNAPAPGSAELSSDQAQCLSQFRVSAPAAPASYPCGTCLPILQGVSPDFANANHADADTIDAAVQFCALKSVFDAAGNGTATLGAVGWMRDVRTCTWSGVRCNGRGRVSSLELNAPAVPAYLPAELNALSCLETLKIVGDNSLPAGAMPTTLPPSLLSLHLETTAITGPLPESLFAQGGVTKLESLTLIRNQQLGASLPASLLSLSLQTLIIRGQNLAIDLAGIASSPTLSKSLRTLDLSVNALTGSVPDLGSTALVTLDLSSNNLSLVPAAFPATLQTLSLAQNPALTGTIPSTICGSTTLSFCDLRQTRFSTFQGRCSVCQFT